MARRDASPPQHTCRADLNWRARVSAGRWDMNTDSSNNLPARRRPVHPVIHERGPHSVVIFMTVCTAERRSLLDNAAMHELLRTSWSKAHHWLVGRYVIMPDHIHLFCAPGSNPPESLQSWVSYWKHLAATSAGGSFWQKNFWDTQLRHHESYDAKWDYVWNNPVRAGLVARPEDWAYQGELNMLRWHD